MNTLHLFVTEEHPNKVTAQVTNEEGNVLLTLTPMHAYAFYPWREMYQLEHGIDLCFSARVLNPYFT